MQGAKERGISEAQVETRGTKVGEHASQEMKDQGRERQKWTSGAKALTNNGTAVGEEQIGMARPMSPEKAINLRMKNLE